MKTEDFDDAFKRKIENINAPINEFEIDSIQQYVEKNKSSNTSEKRIIIIFILSILLIFSGTLSVLNFLQLKENKLLLQKNTELQNNLIGTLHELNLQKKQFSYIPDSSYQMNSLANTKNINTHKTEKPISSTNYTKTSSYQPIAKGLIKETSEYKKTTNNNLSPEGNLDITKAKTNNENHKFNLINQNKELPRESDKTVENKKLIDSTYASLKSNEDSLPKNKTPEKTDLTFSDTTDAGPEKEEKPSIFRAFKYNIGIGAEKANCQFGLSFFGEVLLNKKLSLTTGIKYLKIYNEKYHDEDEFKNKIGKNFKTIYSPESPDTSTVSDIDFKYSVFQIPFSVNYQVPLKNKFSILFSLGTDIDIYAKKYIRYEYRTPNTPRNHHSTESNQSVMNFNNAILAIGFQKQWGRFPVQVCPYISPQFSPTDYKKDNFYYGIRLRILYNLNK